MIGSVLHESSKYSLTASSKPYQYYQYNLCFNNQFLTNFRREPASFELSDFLYDYWPTRTHFLIYS